MISCENDLYTRLCRQCADPENIHIPSMKAFKLPVVKCWWWWWFGVGRGGRGGLCITIKLLKKRMKLDWNFQLWGWGGDPPGRYGYFLIHTTQ